MSRAIPRGAGAMAVIALGCGLVLAAPAHATPSGNGVFFIHGTGDYTPPTSAATAFQASGGTAVTSYWTASSLAAMATSPDGSGQWSYGVAGYQGAGQNAQTSWGKVADQLYDYYQSGNNGAIYNIVAVTHSNGSNPIRYMLAHPTAITPKGRSASTIISVIKKIVFLAPDGQGTPLADKVTTAGSLAAIGNQITSLFGSNWNSPAVWQQRTDNMATYNGNGTFATGTTPGGVAAVSIYGTRVYAAIWSSDAWCGGYGLTTGLYAAALYGFGSATGTDGFIGTASAKYVGTDGGGDDRLNHNQSRRSCHGAGTRIAAQIHGALGGTFAPLLTDYTIAPSAQACNALRQGWQPASPYAGNFYWYGCTSTMRSDSSLDFDCQSAYGGDNGYNLPAAYNTGTQSPYFTSSYYPGGTGCSDSWLGDGECDLCLIAKYGSDAANGGAGPDDCVNRGSGTSNSCADLAYYDQTGSIGYYSYTAVH